MEVQVYVYRMTETRVLRKRRESEYGRKLLYDAVKRQYGIALASDDIMLSKQGKPYFTEDAQGKIKERNDGLGCYFSISHSGEYVVCAIADTEIGCDIQRTRKIPSNLYPVFLEMKACFGIESTEWSEEVQTELWTKYESLGKYMGCGIPIDIKDLESVVGNVCFGVSREIDEYIISVCITKGKNVEIVLYEK